MEKSIPNGALAKSLAAFQAEVGNVAKDGTNPFFKSKYATLENVISTVKRLLGKYGLSYSQFPDGSGLTTVLMHESGEFIEATANLHMKELTPQGQGSAITYMRRYALSSILGIATEDDDDGNAASAPTTVAKKTPLQAPKVVDKITAQKKEIEKLCNYKALAPLLSKEDYEKYIKANTGLVLEAGNYEIIIERLKAL